MPRGYRRVVLAVVGWLILAGAQQPTKQAYSHHSAQQTAPAPNLPTAPAPSPTASETANFTAYPGYDPDRCYHAQNHDAADLCAQWRAAIAAENAVQEAGRATTWAIVATCLSFVGVLGLLWTILQTHGSLAEARRGNRLAMKANARSTRQALAAGEDTKAALAITRNAERAHIVAASASLRPTEEGGNIRLRAGWTIQNTGRTPGFVVKVPITVAVGGLPDDGPVYGLAEFTSRLFVSNTNPMINNNIDIGLVLPIVEYAAFLAGDFPIFLFGVVIYDDVFDQRHSSGFCYKMTGKDGRIFTEVVPDAAYWTTT